ncbi:redoxin domain-containing protein [Cyclobacterium sp.]|uniref:peroxiredoxin family protein n=1 Tax=Cyclobacterium sp. TaxID=1966343 RepID=UPI0019BE0649|nr:redoxin domain-containing protein [Cyclobacterium sp.]MBD3629534.1 TlpA family protein disulfide reductase [Cyclobacterium sp.]
MKICLIVLLTALFTVVQAQEKVQDFSLPSALGNHAPFKLSEAKGKYVALHFLLKTECPFCIRHTHEYVENSPEMDQVIHVFIKPDTEEEIRQWAENLEQTNFPIYRDAEANLAKRLDIPGGYPFHGQLVHYPALILINPEGREVYRYIGKNNRDRLPFKEFKAMMDNMSE